MVKNVTYHNPIHSEENTPLVVILELNTDKNQATAVDSRKTPYSVDLSKAAFGGTSYPKPGSQWYLKKISGVWTLMARAPQQNPQLDPALDPKPGDTFIGHGGTTVVVGDVQVNGNLVMGGSSVAMIGEIRMWPTISAPVGWQLCDGTSLLRTTYATLFSLLCPAIGTTTMTIASPCVVSFTSHGLSIGDRVFFSTTGALPTGVTANTNYWVISAGFGANSFQISATQGGSAINTSGSQSGVHTLSRTYFGVADSTHFSAPDYRGRVPAGRDSSQTEFAAIGETGGEKTHTLDVGEMPVHAHIQDPHLHTQTGKFTTNSTHTHSGVGGGAAEAPNPSGGTAAGMGNTTSTTATSQNTGSGNAHNNLQPYMAINYIIRLL